MSKELIEELLASNAAITEESAAVVDKLRDALESQAREIERLNRALYQERLDADDQRQELEAAKLNLASANAALKAQPSGVVLPEPLKAAIMRADDVLHALAGWESSSVKLEQRHGADWLKEIEAIRRELHTELARLNQQPSGAVLPERFEMEPYQTVDKVSTNYKAGFNAAIKQMRESLNQQPTSGGDERAAIHQLAFELGGTEGGEYWLDAEDLDKVIGAALTCRPDHSEDVLDMVAAWIPVSERLPDRDQGTVAVLTNEGDTLTAWASYWNSASDAFASWTFPHMDDDDSVVTHWMPLPAAPAPSKQGGE